MTRRREKDEWVKRKRGKEVWGDGMLLKKKEKTGVEYGAPPIYAIHQKNFELVSQYSHLNWSFACPGPMIPSPTGQLIDGLRISFSFYALSSFFDLQKVSENYMPFEVSEEEQKIPAESGVKILQSHMPEITVPYPFNFFFSFY